MVEKLAPSIVPASESAFGDRHATALAAVQKALDDLSFGQVVLTVHESKVVQIDVTQKLRFR